MNQVFRKILEDYKRCNKTAKERMINKFGFASEADFMSFLERAEPTAVPNNPVEAPTDMVIAFDTTGSMRMYIDAVRTHVVETIGNMFENVPNLKLKIVAFGDYTDMKSTTEFGKAYQTIELTDSKDQLIKFVREAENTSGGDSEEFYELVLKKILDETSWRYGANRGILLIADDKPHHVGYTCLPFVKDSQIDWKAEAKKAAAMGVKVDTLKIISGNKWYNELSTITGGTCMDFKSSSKTQNIVQASTYLNSKSKMSIHATKIMYMAAMDSGDTELVGAYKGMAMDRGINLED